MIGGALSYLRRTLSDHLRAELGSESDPSGDKVVFVDGDKMDPLSFKAEAVSLLLINVEEERQLRKADPYRHVAEDGTLLRVQPDLRLMLYVLFVARFKQYDAAWDHLTKIMEYLQTHPALDASSTPPPPSDIEKLIFELVTLRFAEQNEIWSALKATHQPSLLYRAKLVVVRDRVARETKPIAERTIVVNRLPS